MRPIPKLRLGQSKEMVVVRQSRSGSDAGSLTANMPR